jgi:hypothetical protein
MIGWVLRACRFVSFDRSVAQHWAQVDSNTAVVSLYILFRKCLWLFLSLIFNLLTSFLFARSLVRCSLRL